LVPHQTSTTENHIWSGFIKQEL